MVRKRSGRLELFSSRKMARAVSRAGTPYAFAFEITRAIKDSLALSDRDQIGSATLRKMVAEELRQRGKQDIAESYLGYKKARSKVSRSLQYKSRIQKTTKSRAKHEALTKDSNRGRPPRW